MSLAATLLASSNMSSRQNGSSARSLGGRSETGSSSALFNKSDITISLKNHYKSKTYTSSSAIEGEVIISSQRSIPFETIEIVLLGSSHTRTEGYSAPHESSHTFLKLTMPVADAQYPVPRTLEMGSPLRIPFTFVLPNFLTLSACNHVVASDRVREEHLCLPPSMGSWARGNWEKDDLAPRMAEIGYAIKARVWKAAEDRKRPVKLMEAVHSIQVLPEFAEQAPLNVTPHDDLYNVSKTKTLRKNLLSSKMGRLTVSGQQPRAVIMHPDGRVSADSVAQLDLAFEPLTADARPPKVTGVSTKITAHTFYAAGPIGSLPNAGNWFLDGKLDRRGVYSTSVTLPAQPAPGNLTWTMTPAYRRRDSGYGSAGSEDDYGSNRPKQRHTATVLVPITLPTAKRTFVPSFHSCILSRVYSLHVSLSVATSGGTSTTVAVELPLQVAVEAVAPELGSEEVLPSWEDAMEAAAMDEMLRPRVIGQQSVPAGAGALPGYNRRV